MSSTTDLSLSRLLSRFSFIVMVLLGLDGTSRRCAHSSHRRCGRLGGLRAPPAAARLLCPACLPTFTYHTHLHACRPAGYHHHIHLTARACTRIFTRGAYHAFPAARNHFGSYSGWCVDRYHGCLLRAMGVRYYI